MLSPATRALAQQRQDELLDAAARSRLRRQRPGNVLPQPGRVAGRVLIAARARLAGRRRDDAAGLRTPALQAAAARRAR